MHSHIEFYKEILFLYSLLFEKIGNDIMQLDILLFISSAFHFISASLAYVCNKKLFHLNKAVCRKTSLYGS